MTANLVWLLAHRADNVAYITDTAEQEFVRTHIRNVVQFSPINMDYPNVGKVSSYTCVGGATLDKQDEKPGFLIVNAPVAETSKTSLNQTVKDSKCVTFLGNIKNYTANGVVYKTQLDPAFIDYLGDILDLNGIIPNVLGTDLHLEAFNFKAQSNLEVTKSVFSSHNAWTDTVGTLAIIPEEKAAAFSTKFATVDKIAGLKVSCLFKGTTPYFAPEKLSITQIASGGRFFLYSINLAVDDKTTVPFIGLGIFGDNKFIKYKNSLCLLEQLQGFCNTQKTIEILFPEKYPEMMRMQGGSIGAMWPTLSEMLGKGDKGIDSKALSVKDMTKVLREDQSKLKIFFLNSTLQKTPEAAQFLAIKSKKDELEKNRNQLQAEVQANEAAIAESEKAIEKALEEILARHQKIKDKKAALIHSTETLVKIQPQALRMNSAVVELSTQVGLLEENYNNAIAKYWSAETDLNLLQGWEKEGFLVTRIVFKDRHTGLELANAQEVQNAIKQRSVKDIYISYIEITTTRPSIIYMNGHKHQGDLSKATAYAGGPYICKITNSHGGGPSMDVELVDDRAFRAFYSSSGYRSLVVHPHTARQNVCTDSTFNIDKAAAWAKSTKMPGHACMGEFAPIAQKGMVELNLSLILLGLKGWLQQANTDDQYGAEVKQFPLVKDVIIDSFGAPKATKEIKISEVKPLFSKQITFVKSAETEHAAAIFLVEGSKLLMYKASGTVAGDKITFTTINDPTTLMFPGKTPQDTFYAAQKEELLKDGYVLYAEAKQVNAVNFEFPFVTSSKKVDDKDKPILNATGSEPYRAYRRVTQEIIDELQAIIDTGVRPTA